MIPLTIGTAVFDDYEGAWATIQALRMYHDLSGVELLIVDNNPESNAGKMLASFAQHFDGKGNARARYIPYTEKTGTTAPRELVFQAASGQAVLCIDSHVLLLPGSIKRLRAYYEAHPETRDLLCGPMLYDGFDNIATHFDDVWRGEMWGTWGMAWGCPCGREGVKFTPWRDEGSEHAQYSELTMNPARVTECRTCRRLLPVTNWIGHERILLSAGFVSLGREDDGEPFEVPGQGLGLFSCRKDAWLGFNPHFTEFGGEEMYIHEKYRQAGARVFCLPFLKWAHRFGRPRGVVYPISRYAKVRNYVLGHQELGLPLDRLREHFVPDKMPQAEWDYLLSDPVGRPRPPSADVVRPAQSGPRRYGRPQPKEGENLDGIFNWCRGVARDLEEHLPTLYYWASRASHVTEFAKRRESTLALAAGRPKTFISYQSEEDELLDTLHAAVKADGKIETFSTVKGGDSLSIPPIAPTELLFIDTVHHADRLRAELERHAANVSRAIILRGTHAFGTTAEGGGPGLLLALREFMEGRPEWFTAFHATNQYGLTVISRDEQDRPKSPIVLWEIGYGPGTELIEILDSLGIVSSPTCDCKSKARQMDVWGVESCKAHLKTIVGWMREGQDKWGWTDKMKAAALAIKTGIAFHINWADPFPGLVELAIQRAEEKEKERGHLRIDRAERDQAISDRLENKYRDNVA